MPRTKEPDKGTKAASRHGVGVEPLVRLNRIGARPDRAFQARTTEELREANRERAAQGRARLHRCDRCGRIDEWCNGWKWFGSYIDEDAGAIAKYCPDCHEPPSEATKRILEKKRHGA